MIKEKTVNKSAIAKESEHQYSYVSESSEQNIHECIETQIE